MLSAPLSLVFNAGARWVGTAGEPRGQGWGVPVPPPQQGWHLLGPRHPPVSWEKGGRAGLKLPRSPRPRVPCALTPAAGGPQPPRAVTPGMAVVALGSPVVRGSSPTPGRAGGCSGCSHPQPWGKRVAEGGSGPVPPHGGASGPGSRGSGTGWPRGTLPLSRRQQPGA